MKWTNLLLLAFFSLILSLVRCDILPTQNEDCEKTNWQEQVETVIYPRFVIYADDVDESHNLSSTKKIQISGNIQRVFCSGEAGYKTTFSKSYENVAVYVYKYLDGDLTTFYFINNKDYLKVIWRVKATFIDGMIFETEEMVQNVYYKDLIYIKDSFYKNFELYLRDVKWVGVSK